MKRLFPFSKKKKKIQRNLCGLLLAENKVKDKSHKTNGNFYLRFGGISPLDPPSILQGKLFFNDFSNS